MRKITSTVVILLLFSATLFAQETPSAAGHWEGKITLPSVELGVLIDLSNDNGVWQGTIDIPMQAAKGLPLINIQISGSSATFEISGPQGNPTFQGTLSADGNTLSGDFTQGGQTFPFALARTQPAVQETKRKSQDEILNEIRERVRATMPDWHVPGLALAVIKDGKVIMAEGFGVKNTTTNAPITPDTLFAIGSASKAFTATIMGVAVDEGLIKWNDPVKNVLPAFRLKDDFADEHMSPKDLLTHRSGLPRHDLMWYGSELSRKEMFDRLHYLEPSEDFRNAFQYQNLMFMTAGYLEEQLMGKPWEALVRERIFDPLGMQSSNFSVAESQKAPDFALPYKWDDEDPKKTHLREIPFRNIDAVGPAGSINSNLNDMAKWVLMNLNGGKAGEKTVVSPAAMDEIHAPHIVIRGGIFSQLFSYPEMPYLMYGMGWFIQPYRGYRMIHHGGNIDGFSAMASFMPDEKLGVVILTNLDGTLFVDSLLLEIYDRLLQLEPIDWNGRYQLKWAQIKEAIDQSAAKEAEVIRKPGTKPSHALGDYAGDYEHPAYGRLSILLEGNSLKASIHGLVSLLEHFHYDLFRATQEEMKGTRFTFQINARGDIDRVLIPLEPSVQEIVFNRIPPDSMRDPAFLQQFAGVYELMGMTITVEVKAGRLLVTVPGQPSQTLEPYRGTEFDLKDLSGYSIKFIVEKNKVTEAVFIQPSGVFSAKRK